MAVDTQYPIWITPHSKKFAESVDLLCKKFVDCQGVPLCLTCSTSRTFTGTTATALLALHHIGKLTGEMRTKFHERLFAYKNNVDDTFSGQKQADTIAWDSLEGLSPWTTSLAIWALLGTGYQGNRLAEIKDAAFWLIDQRQADGKWGRYPQDPTDLFSTSIALHALMLVSRTPALGLTVSEQETVRRVRRRALESIRRLGQQKRDAVYWIGQTENGMQADPTATLCAIWTLHEAKDFDKDKVTADAKLIHGGIIYLREALHENAQSGKPPIWSFRRVIISPPIKGPAWTIVSFTPSFIIPLLAMQCDPFDEICFAPMQWLQQAYLEDEQGWAHHENYGHSTNHALSFTTAYALWAIANWYKYASSHFVQEHSEVKKVKRQRNFALGLLIIISISLLLNLTERFIPPLPIKPLLDWFYGANNALQFVSALLGILSFLFIVLKFVDEQFLGKRLSNLFNRLMGRF